MVIELEFDARIEVRFFFSRLPAQLLKALGQQKQALYDATGPFHNYGSEGVRTISAGGKRFLVYVRLGDSYTGDGGGTVHVVRVINIIEDK